MKEQLDIVKLDCEERFGLSSANWCAAGKFSSLVLGVIFCALIYGTLSLLRIFYPEAVFIEMFFPNGEAERSWIPLLTVLLAMWALGMLMIKRSKLSAQRKAAKILSGIDNASYLNLQKELDDAEYITYLALRKTLQSQPADTPTGQLAETVAQRCSDLEQDSEISFMPISCFIWSVPVLGFIGTVLGLAKAVGNFGALTGADDKLNFNAVLPQVTSGLATAFETTLIALVLALILQIIASFQNQAEAEFLHNLKTSVLNDHLNDQKKSY